jgi:hypothetical protein
MKFECEYYDPESGEILLSVNIEEGLMPAMNDIGKEKGLGLKWRFRLDRYGERVPSKEDT